MIRVGDCVARSRIPKASKKRLVVFGTISVFVIGYFIFTLSLYLYNLYSLNDTKKELGTELIELRRQEKILTSEIEKLKQDEYIAKYARKTYSYSKDGEYIIKLNNKNNKETKKDNFNLNIDYNYIIYGGGLLILVILIYVVKKKK